MLSAGMSCCHADAVFTCTLVCCCAGLQPKDVDIIVTTCSIFCPTPSITSMLVNHFGMRTDVQSYHLGGMGCSNGVVAVNLIKDLLKVCGLGLWATRMLGGSAQQQRDGWVCLVSGRERVSADAPAAAEGWLLKAGCAAGATLQTRRLAPTATPSS